MKKYLKINNLFPYIILFFLLLATYASASYSMYYYHDLFTQWGVRSDILLPVSEMLYETGSTTPQSTEPFFIHSKEPSATFLLVKSSQIKKEPKFLTNSYVGSVIFCDEEYEFYGVRCSYDSVSSMNNNVSLISLGKRILSNDTFTLGSIIYQGHYYIFIPEQYMVSPDYVNRVENYIRSFESSLNASHTKVAEKRTFSQKYLSVLTNKALFTYAFFAVVIFLTSVSIHKLLRTVVYTPGDLYKKETYIRLFHRFGVWFDSKREYILVTLILLILLYIPILWVVSIRNSGEISVEYIFEYLSQTIRPGNFKAYIDQARYLRLCAFVYNAIVLFLFFILLLIPVIKGLLTSFARINEVRFKNNVYKPFFIILINLLVFIVTFENRTVGYTYTGLVLSLLFAYIYFTNRAKVNLSKLFSQKGKKLLFYSTAIWFIVCTLFSSYRSTRPVAYKKEPLIGTDVKLVVLPYSKSYKSDVIFEDFYFPKDSRLFIDNFLVYDPRYKKILNKTVSEFKYTADFLLISGPSNKYLQSLAQNPQLLDYVAATDMTRYFISPKESRGEDGEVFIEFGIDCESDSEWDEIKLVPYSEKGPVDSHNVLNFPGCGKQLGTSVYRVPAKIFSDNPNLNIYEIENFKDKKISSMKIFIGDKELKVTFINDPAISRLLYSRLDSENKSDILTVYSLDLKNDLTFIREDQSFNLSSNLNRLKSEGELKNPFILWSDRDNLLLKNTLYAP